MESALGAFGVVLVLAIVVATVKDRRRQPAPSGRIEVGRSWQREDPYESQRARTATGRLWRRLEQTILPVWVAAPLAGLGLVFIAIYPAAAVYGFSWVTYIGTLFLAALTGLWARTRYRMKVLERSERGIVVSIMRAEKKRAQA